MEACGTRRPVTRVTGGMDLVLMNKSCDSGHKTIKQLWQGCSPSPHGPYIIVRRLTKSRWSKPGVVSPAMDGVNEAGGVLRDVEVVSLFWVKCPVE